MHGHFLLFVGYCFLCTANIVEVNARGATPCEKLREYQGAAQRIQEYLQMLGQESVSKEIRKKTVGVIESVCERPELATTSHVERFEEELGKIIQTLNSVIAEEIKEFEEGFTRLQAINDCVHPGKLDLYRNRVTQSIQNVKEPLKVQDLQGSAASFKLQLLQEAMKEYKDAISSSLEDTQTGITVPVEEHSRLKAEADRLKARIACIDTYFCPGTTAKLEASHKVVVDSVESYDDGEKEVLGEETGEQEILPSLLTDFPSFPGFYSFGDFQLELIRENVKDYKQAIKKALQEAFGDSKCIHAVMVGNSTPNDGSASIVA